MSSIWIGREFDVQKNKKDHIKYFFFLIDDSSLNFSRRLSFNWPTLKSDLLINFVPNFDSTDFSVKHISSLQNWTLGENKNLS